MILPGIGVSMNSLTSRTAQLPRISLDPPKRLIGKMAGFDPVRVFGIKPQSLDALFRKARQRAGLTGIVFHDTRHTAATWLATPRINVLDLCRMFGWSNPKQAMVYYNPSAAEIAKRHK